MYDEFKHYKSYVECYCVSWLCQNKKNILRMNRFYTVFTTVHHLIFALNLSNHHGKRQKKNRRTLLNNNNNKHFHLGVFVHAWIVSNFLTPNCIRGFRTCYNEKKKIKLGKWKLPHVISQYHWNGGRGERIKKSRVDKLSQLEYFSDHFEGKSSE